MLTQETLKELLHYDPDTGIFKWKTRDRKWFKNNNSHARWNSRYANERAGELFTHSGCGKPYRRVTVNGERHLEHRVAFIYMTGSFPEHHTDHLNGDGTDNRWCNLRDVPQSENMKNCRRSEANRSGCTGVGWNKQCGKWKARIMVDRKSVYLGIFESFEEAIRARKQAEIEHGFHQNHGETRPL